ncbi:uncharacterized protein LOC136711098 [Amia ocellicauda]|uniref:uncharacterized protein LOC136711098 n=1 Tax=Amia ocellicauda TaxID=2972642 RepID=UPI003463E3C0
MDGLDSRAALLLFLFLVQRESLCEAAERRTVRAGDTVTLDCGVKHQRTTLWFGQRGEEAPVLVLAVSAKSGTNDALLHNRTNPRFSATRTSTPDSFSLRVENISDTDLALYYCAQRGEMRFGNATRLVYADQHEPPTSHSPISSPSPSSSPTPLPSCSSSPSPPAPCVLNWALLGCVSAGCLLLSGCLCCLWSRRGGVQCVGAQRSPGQSRSEGAAQVLCTVL